LGVQFQIVGHSLFDQDCRYSSPPHHFVASHSAQFSPSNLTSIHSSPQNLLNHILPESHLSALKMPQPSLLDYARFHGLAENHLLQDLLVGLQLCEPYMIQDSVANLHGFTPPGPVGALNEAKFQLTMHEHNVLARSVTRPGKPEWKYLLADHHRIRDLKLEVPILSSSLDHERDMKKLGCGKELDLEQLLDEVGLVDVDEAKDDSISWQTETLALAKIWHREIATERISTTREAIQGLQGMIKDTYTKEMEGEIVKDSLSYHKVSIAHQHDEEGSDMN